MLIVLGNDVLLDKIDTDKSGEVWAIEKETNEIYFRFGANTSHLIGLMWANMPGFTGKDVAVGRNTVYAISNGGQMVYFGKYLHSLVARDEGACYVYASSPVSPLSFAGHAYLFGILRHYRCSKRSHSFVSDWELGIKSNSHQASKRNGDCVQICWWR